MDKKNKTWGPLILSLVIILASTLLAWSVDTSSGKVDVKLVDFIGEDGRVIHGRIYIPKGVTSDNPAPGVVFVHGGDASSDKYSMFSVEFSRRGYVVLSVDQRGQGFSEGPSETPMMVPVYGNTGPEALHYLRTLDIIDLNNVACVGHSMGGAACAYATEKYPDDYSAIVMLGAEPSEGSTSVPRNAATVQGWDDGQLVEGSSILPAFVGVEKIKDIESGKVYGSIAEGTAHVVYFVNTVHNAEYIHPTVISHTLDWIQKTVPAPNPISPSNQVWVWRYIGSTIALGGAIFFMIALGGLLLQTSYFKGLAEPLPEFKGNKGKGWWVSAILTAVIGPATLFYFHNLTAKAPAIWPFARITGIMGWTVLVGVITVVLYFLSRSLGKGLKETTTDNLGLTWKLKLDWKKIGKSLLLSLCIIASTYLLVAIVYNVFQVDLRMWNEGLRLMTLRRVGYAFQYVIPFMLAYLAIAANLHGLLRPKEGKASFGKELLSNILIMSPWYYIWMIWWGPFAYLKTHPAGPPFAGGFMHHWFFAFVPVMLMWTVISTYFYRKTGKVYVGAFLNAFFVCWVILAEQMLASFVLP